MKRRLIKCITTALAFIFAINIGLSQNNKLDSLRSMLKTHLADSVELKTLVKIAAHFTDSNIDSSFYYYDQTIALAKQVDNKSMLGKALANKGVTASIHQEILLSDSLYEEALKIYKKIGVKKSRIVNTYINLLINRMNNANIPLARSYYDSASVYLTKEDFDGNFKMNEMMYYLLSRQEQHEQAKNYAIKTLALVEGTDRLPQIATAYQILASSYSNLSELDSTIFYGTKAIEIRQQHVRDLDLSDIMTIVGGNYMLKKDYTKALPLLVEAEKIKGEYNYDSDLCSTYSALALTYYHTDRLNMARTYCDKIWGLIDKSKDIGCIKEALQSSSKVLKYLGNHSEALKHYEKSIEFRDSINSTENQNTILDLEKRLDLKEKESTISNQKLELELANNKRNTLILVSLGLLCLISLIYFILNQRQKERQRKIEFDLQQEKLESEKHEELSKLKSHFFTNLSHELRTPLTLIMGPLERAGQNLSGKNAKKDIDLAHRNAGKLLGLVNEILDLSKLEAGELKLNESTVMLDSYLKRCFYSFESLAEIRNIKLVLDNQLSNDYKITIDQTKLEKVINNLVSNAIKFSNNDSEIKMTVRELDDQLTIAVNDEGKGIHPDDLSHVFERFYQTKQTGQELEGGTGIGLSYAREIIKNFGGDIKVESELNKGSKFSFTIPMSRLRLIEKEESVQGIDVETTRIKEDEIKAYRSISFDKAKSKLLIVEDNKEMQEYLTSILSDTYDCEVANDGIEALEKTKKQKYDLITSDVMMPRMDGFKFKEAFNEMNENMDTSFIMLTARSLEDDKIRGLKLGVDDYLIKPFSPNELIARIDNLLQNKMDRAIYSRENDIIEQEKVPLNAEQQILKQAEDYILENIDNQNLSVPSLAAGLGYSQRQVTRVLKKLSGLTPVNFILEIRLLKARKLFENKTHLGVDQVRYEIGIDSASYFSRKYKERFGKSPSEELN